MVRRLPAWTGDGIVVQIDLKGGLGKQTGGVAGLGHFSQQHAIRIGKSLPGRSVSVGAIADRFGNGQRRVAFGLHYQRQNFRIVRGIAGQNVNGEDQTACNVHRD